MENSLRTIKYQLLGTLLSGLFSPAVLSAPGSLPDIPLFLGASVEPNVYLVADDSGSMEWSLLASNDADTSGLPDYGGWTGNYYILPTKDNGLDEWYWNNYTNYYPYVMASENYLSGGWRGRNSSYNKLYYNPAITYSPWPGTDASSNPLYNDSPASTAPVDSNNPSGYTLDLTNDFTFVNYTPDLGGWHTETIFPAKYYLWTDDNSNGLVDISDTHTLVEIKQATTSYTGSSDRSDCPAAPTCTYAEEIQNFANWFTYYRKREFAAKNAMGTVINETDDKRMGLDAYNLGNITNAASMSSASDKLTLMQNVYSLDIECSLNRCPSTPARGALNRVGDLFEGSSSPILSSTTGGTCQQNFSIMVSDGFWNGNAPTGIGDADGDNNTDYDGPPYAGTTTNDEPSLADVAMHFYERDLKPTYDNLVRAPSGSTDSADHQHLTTLTVGFGLSGTLDPATDDPTSAGFSWPDPVDTQDAERVDDLWHAAYNGRGIYVSADTPQDLTSGIRNALGEVDKHQGSAAAVAFNTTSLTSNSFVYLALFNSEQWDGDIEAYQLDSLTGAINGSRSWSAASALANDNPDTRTIMTYDGSDGIAFRWSSLTTAQQNDLQTGTTGSLESADAGQARLGYIRGDRNCETSSGVACSGYSSFTSNSLRDRASRLGDIVHSAPVYVGAPLANYPATAPFPTGLGETYADFKNNKATRSGVVYVGSNDGMVHGFSEGSGSEVLAYIPSMLFSTTNGEGLHYLTDPAYGHSNYVDIEPTASDAYIKTSVTGSTGWKTILIGGLRGGGKGLYALDVTSSSFSESSAADTVMWEFTHEDLGYSYSRPSIVLRETTGTSGEWVAVVGNGYNSSSQDLAGNNYYDSQCPYQAALFVIDLEGGIDGSWYTSEFDEICTGVGSASDPNGLSTPAVVDTDNDGAADRAYAGDLHGNLWVFDLTGNTPTVAYSQGNTPTPLFTTPSGQAITLQPEVTLNKAVDTTNSNAPNGLVLFGSGQYLVSSDITDTTSHAFYGVWDHGSKSLTVSNLVQQSITTSSGVRLITAQTVDYSNGDEGWYFTLPVTGERVVNDPLIRDDIVLFTTTIPDNDPCLGGGSGWLMAVDIQTGGPATDTAFDINGDGVVDSNDQINDDNPVGMALDKKLGLPSKPACVGNDCFVSGTNVTDGDDLDEGRTRFKDMGGVGTGRLSWEDLRCPASDSNCSF